MAAYQLTAIENQDRICQAIEDRLDDLVFERDFLIGCDGNGARIQDLSIRIARLSIELEAAQAVCA